MNKVFYIILISLFSLTIISCAKEDDSSSSSTDNSGNSVTLKISTFVIDTTLAGGTIKGSVLGKSSNSALSGVSVSYAKSGTTIVNAITDSSGDFSQDLILGTYTLTYSMSGYLDETQSATLATDNQTLVVSTLRMLSDNCTSGTISGTIKDAVNNNPVTGVSLSVRRGVNVTSGTIVKTDTTSNTGTYSLSSMSAGWYTVETSKSGYITSTFNVYACGDQSGQDTSISTTLDTGAMRIVLSWKTDDDLDAHLTGPDNLSRQGHYNAAHEQFHLYYPVAFSNFYYATNNFSCSGCSVSQKSDNVTLDMDNFDGIGNCDDCGPETITISAVRSGTYRYYVHNFDNAGRPNSMRLYKSKASVKVYHSSLSGGLTKFKAPNMAGDLWTVFEFNNSSGVTRIRTVGSESSSANVDNHGSSLDTTAPSVSSFTLSDTALITGDTATVTLVFSEAVASFSSSADITVANGTLAVMTSTDNITWAGTFTPTANTEDDNNTLSLATSYTDTAGNTGPAATTLNYVVDTTAPTVSSISTTADNQSSVSITDNITVTFSKAIEPSYVTTSTSDTNCAGTIRCLLTTSVVVVLGCLQNLQVLIQT